MWRRDPGVLVRHTPRSVVLSTARTPEPVRVSGFALVVWECLDAEQTTAEVVDDAARRSGLASAEVERRVRDALAGLVELGAVVAR